MPLIYFYFPNIPVTSTIIPFFESINTQMINITHFEILQNAFLPGCQHRGEHLADPTNRCMYKRCVVMSEPWAVNGQIPLDVVSKHCARGSAVPNDYKGGYANPCTARDQTCTGRNKFVFPNGSLFLNRNNIGNLF